MQGKKKDDEASSSDHSGEDEARLTFDVNWKKKKNTIRTRLFARIPNYADGDCCHADNSILLFYTWYRIQRIYTYR